MGIRNPALVYTIEMSVSPLRGTTKTEEVRRRMSEGQRLAWTPERKAMMSAMNSGKPNARLQSLSPEQLKAEMVSMASKRTDYKWAPGRLPTPNQGITARAARLRTHGITIEENEKQRALGNQWCSYLKHWSPTANFTKRKGRGVCDDCSKHYGRKNELRRKFGLPEEWYEETLAKQDRKCAICKSENKLERRLMVDHDHATGKARGLLCHHCNTALERVERQPTWGSEALEYLEIHRNA